MPCDVLFCQFEAACSLGRRMEQQIGCSFRLEQMTCSQPYLVAFRHDPLEVSLLAWDQTAKMIKTALSFGFPGDRGPTLSIPCLIKWIAEASTRNNSCLANSMLGSAQRGEPYLRQLVFAVVIPLRNEVAGPTPGISFLHPHLLSPFVGMTSLAPPRSLGICRFEDCTLKSGYAL